MLTANSTLTLTMTNTELNIYCNQHAHGSPKTRTGKAVGSHDAFYLYYGFYSETSSMFDVRYSIF